MAFLVILKEGRPFLRFRLDKDVTAVGRAPEADLNIPDARVSRLHFVIERRVEGTFLVDRSVNGTYVNQQRVREAALSDGDLILAGVCELRFERAQVLEPPETVMVAPEGGSLAYDRSQERFLFRRPILQVRVPGQPPRQVPIRRDPFRIGSSDANDLRLEPLPAEHVQLHAAEDGFHLRLLEPGPSLSIGGAPARTGDLLPFGSSLGLGRSFLKLELEEGEESLVPLEQTLYQGMVGVSREMRKVFSLIERFARHTAPVVIRGETGTGKELVARALHLRSPRGRGPFVAVNCAAIPESLLESQLFGHVKGAFSGAVRDQVGLVEQAHRGVLFLDELGELPLEAQAKLLRFLETSTVTPVGGMVPKKVDIRVVTATHRDLAEMAASGTFRSDLYYRLMVLCIELPPLRTRREDILPLCLHFLDAMRVGEQPLRLEGDALQALIEHDWPGNIRELRHTLMRAVSLAEGSTLGAREIRFLPLRGPSPAPGTLTSTEAAGRSTGSRLEAVERAAILQALAEHQNNRSQAARSLGIARSTLHERMRRYGIG